MFRADHLLDKPTTQELISNENEHILNYLYKLQEVYNTGKNWIFGKHDV